MSTFATPPPRVRHLGAFVALLLFSAGLGGCGGGGGGAPQSPEPPGTPGPTTQSVNVVLTSSEHPVADGLAVSLVAAIAPSTSTLEVPTGTVVFSIDGADRPATVVNRGKARIDGITLGAGNRTIVARYSGDVRFRANASPSTTVSVSSAWTAPFQASGIDVTTRGLVGDGATDNSAAFDALLNESPVGRLLYFPRGTYLVSRTVDFTRFRDWALIGELDRQGTPISIIRSSTPNIRVVSADYLSQGGGIGSFKIKNMGFVGSNTGGTGFFSSNSVMAAFDNVSFAGHIGHHAVNPFSMAMRTVSFVGPGATANAGRIGFLGAGITASRVDGGVFTGWNEGMRLAGAGVSVSRSRFLRNGVGLNLGVDPGGQSFVFSRAAINDNVFRDNDTAIELRDVATSVFADNQIEGSANAPSGQSAYGVLARYVQLSELSAFRVSGGFARAGISVTGGDHTHLYNNSVTNTVPTGGTLEAVAGLQAFKVFDTDMPNRIVQIDDVTADTVVALTPTRNVINVAERGLVGDGIRDNSPALQQLVDGAATGAIFYFPSGVYAFRSTVSFSRLSNFTILGDFAPYGGPQSGSTLTGDFAAPILSADYGSGAGTFAIRDVVIAPSSRPGSTGLFARNAVLSSLRNVKVQGDTGIRMVNAAYCTFRSVNGFGTAVGVGTGIVLTGGVGNTMDTVDMAANREGIRVSGTLFSLYSSRFEVNRVAINLGVDESGNSAPLQFASVAGVSMEANDNAITVDNCTRCAIGALAGEGSTNAPSGRSVSGLLLKSQNSTIFASEMAGIFTGPALRVLAGSSNVSIITSSWSNGLSSGQAVVNEGSGIVFLDQKRP